MNRWTARLLASLAWLVVVAVGSVLSWLVISRAGAGLVADPGPVTVPTTAAAGPVTAGTSSASAPVAATWQGEVGALTAACTGSDVSLVGAQPEDGRAVRLLDQGPDRLVASFDADDGGAVVTVTARCAPSGPVFTTATGPASPARAPTPTHTDDQGTGAGEE